VEEALLVVSVELVSLLLAVDLGGLFVRDQLLILRHQAPRLLQEVRVPLEGHQRHLGLLEEVEPEVLADFLPDAAELRLVFQLLALRLLARRTPTRVQTYAELLLLILGH